MKRRGASDQGKKSQSSSYEYRHGKADGYEAHRVEDHVVEVGQ